MSAGLISSLVGQICDYWLVLLSGILNITMSATFVIVMDISIGMIYLVKVAHYELELQAVVRLPLTFSAYQLQLIASPC